MILIVERFVILILLFNKSFSFDWVFLFVEFLPFECEEARGNRSCAIDGVREDFCELFPSLIQNSNLSIFGFESEVQGKALRKAFQWTFLLLKHSLDYASRRKPYQSLLKSIVKYLHSLTHIHTFVVALNNCAYLKREHFTLFRE